LREVDAEGRERVGGVSELCVFLLLSCYRRWTSWIDSWMRVMIFYVSVFSGFTQMVLKG